MIPLSFSRVSTFENCQRQFEYLYVTKLAKDQDNQYTIYGNRIHEALEGYGNDKIAGTTQGHEVLSDGGKYDEVRKFLPLVDRALAAAGHAGIVSFEYQMAIRRDLTPCDWFAADVWFRSIADVLVINGDTAYMLDWKTGKIKAFPQTQLKLFACMVMFHFPQVTKVKTAFVWLLHDHVTIDEYRREQLQGIWASILPRLEAVQESVDLGVFKATPSGLCRFCAARDLCPDKRR